MMTAGCLAGISFVSKAIIKSNTRFTAEHSLISTMAFLHTIATTHYHLFDPKHTTANIVNENITEGAKELIHCVRQANNNRLLNVVRPQYLYLTDDTTEYIFQGKNEHNKFKWSLVSTAGLANKSHKAIYKVSKKPILQGMHVKMTFTFAGIGGMAPLFITVPYLQETELLQPDGILIIKIPGLCIGGGGLDPHNGHFGYVVFTCRSNSTNNVNKKRCEYYRLQRFHPLHLSDAPYM